MKAVNWNMHLRNKSNHKQTHTITEGIFDISFILKFTWKML